METEVISTPNGIRTLKGALKYCQDFARVCYTQKSMGEVREEKYNPELIRKLVQSGHHSVFDHFNLSLYFRGLPKAMAMVLNNEPPYATSEKSARYTIMEGIPEQQKDLYDKWLSVFRKEIDKIFPSVSDREKKIQKLAQENARYMTSVFIPTQMGYTLSLRQLNILANNFERFEGEIKGDEFKKRLFEEGMIPFLDSEVVKRFRVKGLEDKSDRGVKLFGDIVEEHYGKDVYSTMLSMSFACLAQNHRHRTIHNHIVNGWQKGAEFEFFIPNIIEDNKKLHNEWFNDLESVVESDFPQSQLLIVAERGLREDLEMKLRERNCGQVQKEIVEIMDILLNNYSEDFPEMEELRKATCVASGEGCKKGCCVFGSEMYLKRKI